MSDPTKYYEAQSSGLSYKEVYNEAGNQARSRFNLPIILEFPKEYTAEERYGWYEQNNFFSTGFMSNGDAQGEIQNEIDDAYFGSKMWEREGILGGKQWYVKGDYNETIQFAPILNIKTGKIRFQKIPANTVLGADLGTKYTVDIGGRKTPNYLLPYNRSQKTQIAANTQNKNIPITAQDPDTIEDSTKPAYIPPTPIGGMAQAPAPSIAETEGITERRDFGGSYVDPDTGKLVTIDTPTSQYDELRRTELGVPEFESMQAFKEQSKDLVKSFLQAPTDQGGYNFKGLDDGKVEFDFQMNENGIITKLDVFEVVNGKRNPKPALTLTDPTETNNKFNEYKRYRLTQDPTDPTLQPPDVTGKKTATGFGATGGGAIDGIGGGIGSFALGQNLMAPGVPMSGSLQQQALSRVPINEYREALPAAMPGGGIPLMRGLSKTPLQLAQEAYFLASRMGTFQPQGTIPGGRGAFEFQQYLGGQPDYIADLQAGLGAIQQVKEKIISGISPTQLTSAEQQIYDNYIGGTEDDPYLGGERELALRQQLTQLLPAPLRQSALTNLQNTYNQALATRPSTVAGMPQSLMYGGALGAGSPFQSMQPMNVTVPTGTSPVGAMSTMGAPTNVSTPSNVVNAPVNMDRGPSSTNNQVTGGLNAPPITTGNVGVNVNVPGQGTRVQLMSEEEADMYYTNLLNSGQLDVLTKQQILASGRYPKVAEANEYIMKYGMSKEQDTQRRVAGAQAQAAAVEKAKQDVINANLKAQAESQAIIGMDAWRKANMPGGLPPSMTGLPPGMGAMPGSNALNITNMTLGGNQVKVPYDPTQNVPLPFDRRFNNMELF